jgi:signal transduction histidine kinase
VRPGLRPSWRIVVVVGAAYSLFAALISYGFTLGTGRSLWTLQPDPSATFSYILLMNTVYWGTWVPLAPVVLAVSSRWRIDARSWRRTVPIHLAAGLAITTTHIVIVATGRTLLQRAFGMDASWGERVWEMFFRTLDWEMSMCGALVAAQHAVLYYGELRGRELEHARLETRLVEAQLQALQQQLHPHFLFNTLHAISALVHRDPDRADAMIERLSDLLRVTLDKIGIQEVTLAEELEYLRAYLDIEQVHFGDRLEVRYGIDVEALDALVPNLILQPLAENAIRHGLEPRARRGQLRVEAERRGSELVLRVADSGRGMPAHAVAPPVPGVGLTNTRSRLERLYGAHAALEFAPNPGGGVVASVRLPLRFRGADEDSYARRRRSADRPAAPSVAAV